MRTLFATIGILASIVSAAQFGPYHAFAPRTWAWTGMLLLDVDVDGDNDMVVTDEIGDLWWWVNDGSGAPATLQPLLALGSQRIYGDICAGDLDGDEDTDLFTRMQTDDSTRWFRNDGGMVFLPMPAFLASSLVYAETFDVDQDGDLDIVAHGSSAGTSLLKNLDGLGTFAPATLLTNEIAGIVDLDVGDMDGDNDLDLLAIAQFFTSPTFHRLEHLDGQGTFDEQELISTGGGSDLIAEYGCAWLDIDGDGDLEPTACASGDLSYYLNNDGLGTLDTIAPTGLNTGIMKAWTKLDLDGDSDMDLVAVKGNHGVWLETVAPGSFTLHTSVDLPVPLDDAAVGDVDGDGNADLAFVSTTGRAMGWIEDIAAGFGAWHYVALEPSDPADLASADMDGDGDVDAVVAATTNNSIGWYPNTDANGAFGEFSLITSFADSVLAIDVSDVDGDTDMDVLAVEARSGELSWFENADGLGTSWQEHAVATGLARPNLLSAMDLDQDGDDDIVFTTYLDHLIRYSLNTGGSFDPPQLIADPVFLPVALEIADLNGDNWMEVIVAGQTGSPNDIIWYQGLFGGITFGGAHIEVNNTSSTVAVHAADLDGDGDNDLVYSHQGTGRLSWLQNNGFGTFQASVDILNNPQINDVLPVDVDSDGAVDLLCIKMTNGGATWVRSLGGGAFAPVATLTTELRYGTDILSTDMDQDGDPDLLMCGTQGDDVATIENFFGTPYRINGNIFLDLDADGTPSGGDQPALFIPVISVPYVSTPYTNAQGDYSLYLEEGAYMVSAPLVNPCWELSTSSASYNEVLTPIQPMVSGRDFGYAIGCDTTIVSVARSSGSICESQRTIDVHLYNTGTTTPEGTLRVTLDPLTTLMSSAPSPTAQDGDTLWFDVTQLDYFEHQHVQVRVTGPGVDFIGDTMYFDASFFAEDDLGSPLGEFSTAWEQRVLCSYDPNDKAVEPAGAGSAGLIPIDTERLMYTVRFQNTGNDTAATVVIHDQLSPYLDRSSLQVLGWTHPLTLRVEGDGEALFAFDNIMLPDSGADQLGSQGHVIFSIALLPGLSVGAVINNTAQIVFDLNPPIITNTTVNTLFDCALATASISDIGNNTLLASPGVEYQWFLNGVEVPGADEQSLVATQSGNYSVTVTDTIGCTPTSAPYPLVITGMNDLAVAQIICYPDPFTHDLTVLLASDPGPGTVLELIDAQGRTVRRILMTGRSMVIQGDGLPAGVFTLRCTGANNIPQRIARVVHLE